VSHNEEKKVLQNSKFKIGSLFGCVACVTLPFSSSAFADEVPALGLTLNQESWVDTSAGGGTNGEFVFDDMLTGTHALLEYRVTVFPENFSVLGFSFDITNTSNTTQIYTLTSAIAVDAMPAGCLLGASIGGSVTDANFDGSASLTSAFGNPLFWGGLDFAAPFAGGTASVGPESIGLPGPSAPGAAFGAGYQSIALRFALSAGDRASFSGVFVLQPVPAPAALAMFAIAGLGTNRRRR
jgi:hypothetical protein